MANLKNLYGLTCVFSDDEEDDDCGVHVQTTLPNTGIYVEKMSIYAMVPTRSSSSSPGWDLYSSNMIIIPAGGRRLVPTDIRIAIPKGMYGRLAPRAKNYMEQGYDIMAGTIESDFRSAIMVLAHNMSNKELHILRGDRIAQLIISTYETVPITVVQSLPK